MKNTSKKTFELLLKYGISNLTLDEIIKGKVSWDIVDDDFLILIDDEGSTQTINRLSLAQVDELLNVHRFESRTNFGNKKSNIFIQGTIDDWAGVSQNTNWREYVDSYINSAHILGESLRCDCIEPYLFVCRHSIELILKSIIMLYQELNELAIDLPDHHSLSRLWTSSYPIVNQYKKKNKFDITKITGLISEYDFIDSGSYAFRYPVRKGNSQIKHEEYLKSFSLTHHKNIYGEVVGMLNEILRNIELEKIFKPINEMLRKNRLTSDVADARMKLGTTGSRSERS